MPTPLTFREATHADLPAIAALLADDVLGTERDGNRHMDAYAHALSAIQAQRGNAILLAMLDADVVGLLQLTFIPGLSRGGMLRAQIEGVRVGSAHRGQRIGEAMFAHAIQRARDAGCGLVQLTTDKRRPDAHRFYERLGFEASHEGLKLTL